MVTISAASIDLGAATGGNAARLPAHLRPNGHWSFPEQLGGKHSGFVYVLRDNVLGRFYMGKKFFTTGAGFKESDWKTYKSSSNTIKTILQHRPWSEFDAIVLEQYRFKGAVGWAETWGLVQVKAPFGETWYNKRIEEVTWNVSEDVTDRHKDRLERVMNMETFEE